MARVGLSARQIMSCRLSGMCRCPQPHPGLSRGKGSRCQPRAWQPASTQPGEPRQNLPPGRRFPFSEVVLMRSLSPHPSGHVGWVSPVRMTRMMIAGFGRLHGRSGIQQDDPPPPRGKQTAWELAPWGKAISVRQGLRIRDGSSGCLVMINDLLLAIRTATLISF